MTRIRLLTTAFAGFSLAFIAAPLHAQTLRPDASGIPQPAPATGGGAPGVGTGNDVKVGVAGLSTRGLTRSATLVVRGSGQRMTYNAGGRDVSIQGTGNTITLRGNVRRLTIIGRANRVSADAVSQVSVSGAGNAITYRGSKKASVDQSGGRNQVRRAQ